FTYGGSAGSRTLNFLPVTNQFGSATITVNVTDSDGGSSSTSFLLTVNPVNDPPTLDLLADLTVNEDSGGQTIPLTGITSGPANESSQSVSLIASNSNPGLLTNLTVSYTNPASNGILTFGIVPNAFGTAVVTVIVNDGE